jgi:hypothetical protein
METRKASKAARALIHVKEALFVYRCRRGLTKLELLVVVAVVVFLLSLLMPAFPMAREPARRAQCRNNLKQLGLALHNYHDSHKMFPPGIVGQNFGPTDAEICQFVAVSPKCDNPRFSSVTALTVLLPFMDDRQAYAAYNQQLASCAMENHTAVSTVVKAYICPTNPRRFEPISLPYYLTPPGIKAAAGPTDYVLSIGGVGLFNCENPFALNGSYFKGIPGIMKRAAGPFNVNRGMLLEKFKDGAATTFLMGESVGGAELFVGLVGKNIVGGGERMTGASSSDICDNAWSQGWISSRSGGSSQGFGSVFGATAWNAWYDPQGMLTDPGNGVNWFPYLINEAKLRFNRPTWAQNSRPAADITASNGATLPSSAGSVQGFRSHHPGMAQFLLGDGSVRSLSENIDAKILVAYSTVIGREPVELSE